MLIHVLAVCERHCDRTRPDTNGTAPLCCNRLRLKGVVAAVVLGSQVLIGVVLAVAVGGRVQEGQLLAAALQLQDPIAQVQAAL